MKLNSSLKFSHYLLENNINYGDTAIDATVGNGNDTLFLSKLVGKTGHVYGFDIQKLAINNTKNKLQSHKKENCVTLFQTSHDQIFKLLGQKQIKAAIFNLGYLPGGNKKIITHANTTIKAIQACLKLLKTNGMVILVIYYGHPGGIDEKNHIESFTSHLDQKKYNVLKYQFINQVNEPPILIAIQKR
ncbi:rRNA methyltransferase [Philodulcilactobacillus myokoensis]|uniref:rRNA methyltransferase n=1 Tax=Philodulcilactobacillus myokoensis TaxID=2929573 RepID=A0A9W6ESU5_9LACO|nr:class I SAM-dependent methyltransferase [Philodulcilactobacillus myokoensis]GLB46718.1 rRNA methyltransferase [Philodulcilactobacillus myokoensis]